jgi:hypothetical protein
VVVVANYTSRSSFTNCFSHLKGEEVFGSAKQLANCPLGANKDSDHLDCVNFTHPWVLIVEPDIVEDVHIEQSPFSFNNLIPAVS